MTAPFIALNENFLVSPQISVDDVDAARADGVAAIVNNRPDNEAPGQPAGDAIKAAAEAAGLVYSAIPVGPTGISHDHLDALMAVIEAADGPVLAYCKSGTRSVILRAFALARAGHDADALVAEAMAAGYDIQGHRPALAALGA